MEELVATVVNDFASSAERLRLDVGHARNPSRGWSLI